MYDRLGVEFHHACEELLKQSKRSQSTSVQCSHSAWAEALTFPKGPQVDVGSLGLSHKTSHDPNEVLYLPARSASGRTGA